MCTQITSPILCHSIQAVTGSVTSFPRSHRRDGFASAATTAQSRTDDDDDDAVDAAAVAGVETARVVAAAAVSGPDDADGSVGEDLRDEVSDVPGDLETSELTADSRDLDENDTNIS